MNELEQAVETEHPAIDAGMIDTRPDAAWAYAHRRPRGVGIWAGGSWLASFPEKGEPTFTPRDAEALCFASRKEANPIGFRLVRHLSRAGDMRRVHLASIPAGAALAPCECEHEARFKDQGPDVAVLNGPEHGYLVRMGEAELARVATLYGGFAACAPCRAEHFDPRFLADAGVR